MSVNILANVSPALGVFALTVLFLICLGVVVGTKILLCALKGKPVNLKEESPERKPVKKRKVYRTAVINPEEVDRVYFRKSS